MRVLTASWWLEALPGVGEGMPQPPSGTVALDSSSELPPDRHGELRTFGAERQVHHPYRPVASPESIGVQETEDPLAPDPPEFTHSAGRDPWPSGSEERPGPRWWQSGNGTRAYGPAYGCLAGMYASTLFPLASGARRLTIFEVCTRVQSRPTAPRPWWWTKRVNDAVIAPVERLTHPAPPSVCRCDLVCEQLELWMVPAKGSDNHLFHSQGVRAAGPVLPSASPVESRSFRRRPHRLYHGDISPKPICGQTCGSWGETAGGGICVSSRATMDSRR